MRNYITAEADAHRLCRFLIHIFLGVFIGWNHNSLPEAGIFGITNEIREMATRRRLDLLACGLLDFASSILEYPGYSSQPSGDWAHYWLSVGGHGEV